ncbi:hypothetical protein LZC95_44590 [Pendulispora brunnea]|uniref:Uncharacterized protein n=1 Tax=Pendulispora brunnea TaxID=2905690 RepID=A0ABZ2K9K4_9BACT
MNAPLLYPALAFASPRKLPKVKELKGRVVVLDIAFASEASGKGFDDITRPFIEQLGPRLAGWVDHHDHVLHAKYKLDPRFVLATKAEHGACPEMVTPDVVARIGPVDTVVCHNDFDGLCSAAKWIRQGVEPYPGADADARAIDTRIGTPSAIGARFDRALRARPRDLALFGIVVRHLASGLNDASLWERIDEAASELSAIEQTTREIAMRYAIVPLTGPAPNVAFLEATDLHGRYDKTLLLLMGQARARIAMVLDRDTLTLAAPFDSGLDFLSILGLSGGMPTLVSIQKERLREALEKLGAAPADVARLM